MKVVYIAGKFRGPDAWSIESNIRAAEALALEVWRLGAAALCPHTNTRFFQGAAPDALWLQGDLVMLDRALRRAAHRVELERLNWGPCRSAACAAARDPGVSLPERASGLAG